jgi:hypothetical protein
MKEGKVPVPPHRPCAESDDNVVPVQELSHFLRSRSGGVETSVVCSGFFEHFCRAVIYESQSPIDNRTGYPM